MPALQDMAAINRISVGMGEMVIANKPDTELLCLGLGSCIAVCAYDARRRIGAMIHVVLPTAPETQEHPPGKYANTAIPAMLDALRRLGCRVPDMRVVLCGGAAIFASLTGTLDIGNRNIHAVHAEIARVGLRVVREEIGGRESRTVTLSVATGTVRLRSVRMGEVTFAELGTAL